MQRQERVCSKGPGRLVVMRDDRDPNDSAVPRTWSSLAECISDAET